MPPPRRSADRPRTNRLMRKIASSCGHPFQSAARRRPPRAVGDPHTRLSARPPGRRRPGRCARRVLILHRRDRRSSTARVYLPVRRHPELQPPPHRSTLPLRRQFRGRRGQSAGARHSRRGDPPRPPRPVHPAPHHRRDPRPRHPFPAGDLGEVSGRAARAGIVAPLLVRRLHLAWLHHACRGGGLEGRSIEDEIHAVRQRRYQRGFSAGGWRDGRADARDGLGGNFARPGRGLAAEPAVRPQHLPEFPLPHRHLLGPRVCPALQRRVAADRRQQAPGGPRASPPTRSGRRSGTSSAPCSAASRRRAKPPGATTSSCR